MKHTKQFETLTWGEISSALIEMLEKLGIAGSTATYNLYRAIEDEWYKAKKVDEKGSYISVDNQGRTIDIIVPSHGYTLDNPYWISWDRIDEDWFQHLGGKVWWTRKLEAGLHDAMKMVKMRQKYVRK